MNIEELCKRIIQICIKYDFNKIYICGNGGSGKTTLSKKIAEIGEIYGNVNIISLDDFMIDNQIKNQVVTTWQENEINYQGRLTSSSKESYYLKNVYEILYNIDHHVDCFYFPFQYLNKNNIRQLKSTYFLTILEGVGTYYLKKDDKKSLTILLKCNQENEIKRRKERTKKLKRENSELYDEIRSSQYRVNILSHEEEFNMIIINDELFDFKIIKNIY